MKPAVVLAACLLIASCADVGYQPDGTDYASYLCANHKGAATFTKSVTESVEQKDGVTISHSKLIGIQVSCNDGTVINEVYIPKGK